MPHKTNAAQSVLALGTFKPSTVALCSGRTVCVCLRVGLKHLFLLYQSQVWMENPGHWPSNEPSTRPFGQSLAFFLPDNGLGILQSAASISDRAYAKIKSIP